jgi:hypothetical protein
MATKRKETWKYTGATALTGGELLKWTALGACDIATAETDKIIGTAAHAAIQNDFVGICPLVPSSTIEVIASAAVAAGDYLKVTTGGKVVTTTPKATFEASAVEWILGWAEEAAANADEVISMVCMPTSQSQT